MFKKIAAIVNHPYAAPVTETFKGIFKIAKAPLKGFIEAVEEGMEDNRPSFKPDEDYTPTFVRVYKEIISSYDLGPQVIGILGALIGGAGIAIGAGIATFGAGAGVVATVAASIAGLGIGVAAGPFVLAGVIGLGAAAVGSVVGGVPGFIKGVSKVIDYHRNRAAYEQAMQNLPAQTPAKDDVAKKVTPLLAEFNTYSQDQKEAFVRMMVEQHEGALTGRSDKIMKAVEGLPEAERHALAEKLKDSMRDQFKNVTVREPVEEDEGPIIAPRTASFSRRAKIAAAI